MLFLASETFSINRIILSDAINALPDGVNGGGLMIWEHTVVHFLFTNVEIQKITINVMSGTLRQ